jgi:hypothetical protein
MILKYCFIVIIFYCYFSSCRIAFAMFSSELMSLCYLLSLPLSIARFGLRIVEGLMILTLSQRSNSRLITSYYEVTLLLTPHQVFRCCSLSDVIHSHFSFACDNYFPSPYIVCVFFLFARFSSSIFYFPPYLSSELLISEHFCCDVSYLPRE